MDREHSRPDGEDLMESAVLEFNAGMIVLRTIVRRLRNRHAKVLYGGAPTSAADKLLEVSTRAKQVSMVAIWRRDQPVPVHEICASRWLQHEGGIGVSIVFFLGGLYRFRSATVQKLYEVFFLVSVATCFGLCVVNLGVREVPYRNVSTDLLTVYCHLPAVHAWYVWKHCECLRDAEMHEVVRHILITSATYSESKRIASIRAQARRRARILSVIMFLAMIVLSVTLLLAFAAAAPFEALRQHESYLLNGDAVSFRNLHSWLMWLFIIPVVCSLLGSYALLLFYVTLHGADFQLTAQNMILELDSARHFQPSNTLAARMEYARVMPGVGKKAFHALLMQHHYDKHCESIMRRVSDKAERAQARLDTLVNRTSRVNFHLLIFTSFQLLVVIVNVESHVDNRQSFINLYTDQWWWYFIDAFHGFCGLVLFLTQLGAGALLTSQANNLTDTVVRHMREGKTQLSKVAIMHSILELRVTGFQIAGMAQNWENFAMTCWALAISIWTSFCIAVINAEGGGE